MPAEIVDKREKERIIWDIDERFGINKLNYLLFKTGREKVRAFSGHLSRDELKALIDLVVVEIIGIYLLKEEKNGEFRLSLDGSHLLKEKINKNILDIDDETATRWLRGEDINVPQGLFGIYAVRNGGDFLGCGKASNGKMINFIPKERRIR